MQRMNRDYTNALAKVDGLIEESLVTKYVEEALGKNAKESINLLYTKGKDYIASLASCVFRAAKENDQTAVAILERNSERVAKLIDFTAEKYNCFEGVILSGSIAGDKEQYGDRIYDKLRRKIRLIYTDTPQVIGASRVCLELFSKKRADKDFTVNLKSNYDLMR